MFLNEDNYSEKIYAYNREHWQPLLELIPAIASTDNFGEMKGGEKNEESFIQMPYYEESSLVDAFRSKVYDLGLIIDFDWTNWEGGNKIMNESNFDFDTIRIPEICKLITAIIRKDRFSEGTLVSAFSEGLILKMLQSINRQINAK
jgi:hypothetical protein